jgi:hypothetical protein
MEKNEMDERTEIVADAFVTPWKDGKRCRITHDGVFVESQNGMAAAFGIDGNDTPVMIMASPTARLEIGCVERPVIKATHRGETMLLNSSGVSVSNRTRKVGFEPEGIVIADGKRERVSLTTAGVGYIARLARDGLMVIPFGVRESKVRCAIRRLLSWIGARLPRRASTVVDDEKPVGLRIFPA